MYKTSKAMAARDTSNTMPRVVGNALVGTMTPLKNFFCIQGAVDNGASGTITDAITGKTFTDNSGDLSLDADGIKFTLGLVAEEGVTGGFGTIAADESILIVLSGTPAAAAGLLQLKPNGFGNSVLHARIKDGAAIGSSITDEAGVAWAYGSSHAAVVAGTQYTLIAPFDRTVVAPKGLVYEDTVASKDETAGMLTDFTTSGLLTTMDSDINFRGIFNSASVFVFSGALPADYVSWSLWMSAQHALGNYVFPKHWATA
ncbi:hypothetical protein KAT92_06685 [Candidatus Babeliales bacterium]|nr:hypothetical protein [Candidatus Babeliales bacterium]